MDEIPLHLAAKLGNLDEVQQLIEGGAIINEARSDGFTALHLATDLKHMEVVKYLLAHGADVNAIETSERWSPLHFATANNDPEMIRLLTEAGANMQCTSNNGYMPIHAAAREGYLEIVKYFLEKGIDVNVKVHRKNSVGFTALHIAAEFKHTEVVKYLLAHGADVNASVKGWSPLHYATYNNDLEMIRLFTEAGANEQCSNNDGWKPIHIAARKGYLEIVKYFLENGLDVDITIKKNKKTPIHLAARWGHIEIVDYLLLNKANVCLKDCQKRNSIHHGVLGGNAKIVKILLEKGADINAKDILKLTPLHLACRDGYLEIVHLLLKKGAVCNLQERSRNNSPLHLASETGCLETVKYFIGLGADVNFGTNQEYTLLHAACKWDKIEMVKFLIENGADVNKKTLPKGATPLYFAIRNMYPEVSEFLLLNGADLKQAQYKGNCPLWIALKHMSGDYPEAEHTKYMVLAKVIIKYTVLIYNHVETIIPDGCPFVTELLQYYNDCQKEITRMRSVIIKNSTVSLYQIICDSNKGNAFIEYLRNDKIKIELQNIEDYLKDFSIYGNILPLVQHWVKEGFQRIELLSDADIIMNQIAPKLPSEISWKIFDYLNMTDLKTVIQSDLFK